MPVERILGQLLEHAKSTNERLATIEADIRALKSFYLKLAGGIVVISTLLTLCAEFFIYRK